MNEACVSKTERRVVDLLCDGLTPAQIAVELGVDPSTVREHIRNLRRKAGAESTNALVVHVLRGRQAVLEDDVEQLRSAMSIAVTALRRINNPDGVTMNALSVGRFALKAATGAVS